MAYFLAIYIFDSQFINNTATISTEMNVGTSLEAYFAYAWNVQREMIYNKSKPVLIN
jgi:hypothetical protein